VIDEKLLKILTCPFCKNNVILKDNTIICVQCQRKYPIKDGIPVMLMEEAQLNEKNEEK
jgi:uncharacterized protein YbaR (Trm112 family)